MQQFTSTACFIALLIARQRLLSPASVRRTLRFLSPISVLLWRLLHTASSSLWNFPLLQPHFIAHCWVVLSHVKIKGSAFDIGKRTFLHKNLDHCWFNIEAIARLGELKSNPIIGTTMKLNSANYLSQPMKIFLWSIYKIHLTMTPPPLEHPSYESWHYSNLFVLMIRINSMEPNIASTIRFRPLPKLPGMFLVRLMHLSKISNTSTRYLKILLLQTRISDPTRILHSYRGQMGWIRPISTINH